MGAGWVVGKNGTSLHSPCSHADLIEKEGGREEERRRGERKGREEGEERRGERKRRAEGRRNQQ